MRDIKTLLEILLDQYQNHIDDNIRSLGLSWAILFLRDEWIISGAERIVLRYYMLSNKPEKRFNGYWWPAGEIEPRVEFLKQLIK